MKRVIETKRLPIKLWLDDIEHGALKQAHDVAQFPFAQKWIAIMPDSHQGYGMPIGGVMATKDVIVPNAVGVDIGCGMVALQLNTSNHDLKHPEILKKILGDIRKKIPLGFNHHETSQHWEGFNRAPDLEIIQQEVESSRRQLGTLGGGNHFIEIQFGDDGHYWLMLHSGSRNIGFKTANFYHKKAIGLCQKWKADIPNKDLSFLPMTEGGREYYLAMKWCLEFAAQSRGLMITRVLDVVKSHVMGTTLGHSVNIHHNYADFEHHYGKNYIVHRKGATKATLETTGIIPGSMGTNSYIVKGLGNPESFMSCSHGAGRTMSRSKAKELLSLEAEKNLMGNVVHGLRNTGDLDEAPSAYKDINTVMKNQEDLVDILVKLTPLASIKK